MARLYMFLAALFGGTGVLAGAFASHGLRGHLSDRALSSFETATRYQLYHALALLVVALLLWFLPMQVSPARRSLGLSGAALITGIVLFCGSLYGLSLGAPRSLGWVTPMGGIAFLGGWIGLAIAALRFPQCLETLTPQNHENSQKLSDKT